MSYVLNGDLGKMMPVHATDVNLKGKKVGYVYVDPVNGFCTVGAGALAPPAPNPQVDKMIRNMNALAKINKDNDGKRILIFQDTHTKPEPPYPDHCMVGTGEELLVDDLKWIVEGDGAYVVEKDCINGYVGSNFELLDGEGTTNEFVEWANSGEFDTLVILGICTDICVMDFVLTALSSRNHGELTTVKDIVVFEPGCATYDLPLSVAVDLKLPETAAHPQYETHHMGLYFMASRGAIIARGLHEDGTYYDLET